MGEARGVSNAVLAERIKGVREDVAEIMLELGRARTRLHNLEGIAQAFVDAQNQARQREERQYRRLELRLQGLAVVLGLATIVVPIIVAILATH